MSENDRLLEAESKEIQLRRHIEDLMNLKQQLESDLTNLKSSSKQVMGSTNNASSKDMTRVLIENENLKLRVT
jgi:hypothetical protein